MVEEYQAEFYMGQLVHHKLFNYRGVIVDVDPTFSGSESWYRKMAISSPPKNKPWYHVLVHNTSHSTYVAERNLEPDGDNEPINHPMIKSLFEDLGSQGYILKKQIFI